MLVVLWIWLLPIARGVNPSFGFLPQKLLFNCWRNLAEDQVGDTICIFCYMGYISHRRITEGRQGKER